MMFIGKHWRWLLLMALAPVAGGFTSYFVLTWRGSGGGDRVSVVEKAVAQPSSPKGRLTIEQAQAIENMPVFWAGPAVAGMPLTAIVRQAYTPPAEIGVPPVDQVNVGYGDCTGVASCVIPLTITSTRYCLSPPESAGRGVFEEPPFQIRGATARWVAPGRNTLVLFTGQSTITIIATEGEEVALDVARRLVAINRPPAPQGEGAPVAWGPSSPAEPLGPVAISCP